MKYFYIVIKTKREKKDEAITNRFHQRFENGLEQLNLGLSKKGTTKSYEKIVERIGRLKEKNSRAAQEYEVKIKTDKDKKNATDITWKKIRDKSEKSQLLGVYCLRTNIKKWSEKTLWSTYVMLTDLEATFRSMKTELGMRPVYHQKENRVTSHIFITLLAYHLVHTIRYQLKLNNIDLSWESIRQIMSVQQRVTLSLQTIEKLQIFVRVTSEAEIQQKSIYEALGISSDPLGKQIAKIDCK